MIFDHISNLAHYRAVHHNLKKFIDYLAEHDMHSLSLGKHVIDDDVFFTVKCYEPRAAEKAGWESHRQYIDIQYVMEGRELMGVMPSSALRVMQPYDAQADKTTYEPVERESTIRLTPGMFVLLLPQDAHHPTILDGEVTQNKKVVVKLHI